MSNAYSHEKFYIRGIFPTDKIVVAEYKKNKKVRCHHITETERSVHFFYSFNKDKISKLDIHYIPPSRLVFLSKERYEYWGIRRYYYAFKGDLEVIIQSDLCPSLYEILGFYHNGYNLVSREERFRNLYLAYEQLSENIELPIKAVRHSFSHSRTKLTNKQIREFLIENFGDVKINLKKYSHNKKFYKIFIILGEKCESIIVDKILKLINESPTMFDKYYIPRSRS